MPALEIGRICTKTRGKETGKKCVVIDVIDENYVLVDGPKVKRRRCNTSHLDPAPQKIDVKKGASTKQVKKVFKKTK